MSRPPASKGRAKIRSYHDLTVWQHAVEVFIHVTKLIRSLPFSERLVFETQTRRAARGVAASIAEGFRRWDLGDYARSVSYANGSLAEVETDLHLIALVNDVDINEVRHCVELCDHTRRELINLGNSLRRLRESAKPNRKRPV